MKINFNFLSNIEFNSMRNNLIEGIPNLKENTVIYDDTEEIEELKERIRRSKRIQDSCEEFIRNSGGISVTRKDKKGEQIIVCPFGDYMIFENSEGEEFWSSNPDDFYQNGFQPQKEFRYDYNLREYVPLGYSWG